MFMKLLKNLNLFKIVKQRYYRRKINDALALLSNTDRLLKKAGYSRQIRRQFYREFAKSDRKERILKDLLGIK